MPYPDRLQEWVDSHHEHPRILGALIQGAIAGALGDSLLERARELGYEARTPQGDAFEEAYLFAQEERRRRFNQPRTS